MKKYSVARRYAQALFELLDQSDASQMRAALTALGDALTESAPLQHVMASPTFSLDDKIGVLTALGRQADCPTIGQNFLAQLVKANRVVFLPEIAQAFGELLDQFKGTQPVEVVSARPLDATMEDDLKARLKTTLRREVDLGLRVDPTLVAGLQIRIGSLVYDSSLRNRLDTMHSLLTRQ